MNITVSAKTIGPGKQAVEAVPLELKGSPKNLRDLVCLCVEACVENQHRRLQAPEEAVLSAEEIDGLSRTGKIAFGVDYNGAPAKLDEAIENALQSCQDGLFRVFLNGRSVLGLDTPLQLAENDRVAFIRLIMLAGRPW